MRFLELWRLSKTVYKEVSFQSIYSLRSGAVFQQKHTDSIRKLVRNAMTNTLLSKVLTAFFIAAFGITTFFPLTMRSGLSGSSKELMIVGGVSAFLAAVLSLMALMGLQVATSLVSSKITDILSPLPLSKRDLSTIVLLCFIRIFDLPLIVALVTFPTFYYVFSGSILGCLTSFLGISTTEVFALALTVGLARFFYARIASGGGSKWKTFLRAIFMLMWVLPSFGAYFVINFASQIVEFFANLTQTLSTVSYLLVVIYPFSYGFLVSYTSFAYKVDLVTLGISITSCLGYSLTAAHFLKWLSRTMRKISSGGILSVSHEIVRDTFVKPRASWLGIIRKDLMLASRLPAYASLFILPAIQTVILAVSFSSFGGLAENSAFGVLTGMSFLILLIPTALFAIEGLGSAYIRSLPLTKKTMILAKTVLSTLTYVISLAVFFVMTLIIGKDFGPILTYGVAHVFSVAAANMLELMLLANKYWKEGFAIGNLYSRLITYVFILIPGLVVVLAPIIAAITTYVLAGTLALPVFLAIAISEFAVITLVTLRVK